MYAIYIEFKFGIIFIVSDKLHKIKTISRLINIDIIIFIFETKTIKAILDISSQCSFF